MSSENMEKDTVQAIRLSSNLTIFLALFLPVFWIVFFGLFSIMIFKVEQEYLPFPALASIRWIILACVLCFFLFLRLTIIRLKRIEASDTHLFVSNYVKNYRYPLADIDRVNGISLGLARLGVIYLRHKGKFGKKILFIMSKSQMKYYVDHQSANNPFTSVLG